MTPIDPNATNAAAPAVDLLAEPTFEECILEWNRYHEDKTAGRLNNTDVPGGHHFAYFGGRIIDHDADYMTLCERAAKKAGVHWARLVMDYRQLWLGGIIPSASAVPQYEALVRLHNELQSILQNPALGEERVASATVLEWLQGLLDTIEKGLGKIASAQ